RKTVDPKTTRNRPLRFADYIDLPKRTCDKARSLLEELPDGNPAVQVLRRVNGRLEAYFLERDDLERQNDRFRSLRTTSATPPEAICPANPLHGIQRKPVNVFPGCAACPIKPRCALRLQEHQGLVD